MKLIRRILLGVSAIALVVLFVWNSKDKKEEVIVVAKSLETVFTIVETPAQTQAMEHERFIVEEYVAVLPSGTNIALAGKLDANNNNTQYTAMKANDDTVVGSSYWEGAANSYPGILTLDARQSFNIHAIRVCLNPATIWGDRTQTFSVWTSSDGEQYTELIPNTEYDFSPATGNEVILEFDPAACQFVQLQFTANSGATGGQVAEFQVYSKD